MDTQNTYCVEYSISQQCFHIDTLANIIIQNKISAEESRITDYKIIGVCYDYESARALATSLDMLYEKQGIKQRNREAARGKYESRII